MAASLPAAAGAGGGGEVVAGARGGRNYSWARSSGAPSLGDGTSAWTPPRRPPSPGSKAGADEPGWGEGGS